MAYKSSPTKLSISSTLARQLVKLAERLKGDNPDKSKAPKKTIKPVKKTKQSVAKMKKASPTKIARAVAGTGVGKKIVKAIKKKKATKKKK
jgi:hypothetical protein